MDAPFANRLPPELLLTIATFTDQNTIFRLATVCKYWHDVLTGTATLWTSIDCRNESRTSILLLRSKSSPIDVIIDRFVPEAISLVANHTHRMRSIDVDLYPHQFRGIRPLLNELAPILETMRMMRRQNTSLSTRRRGAFPPYTSFFRGEFPALRTLYLEGYPLDLTQSSPMMTNGLTTLVLNSRQSYNRRDLFEYLEHCENLAHLRIDLPYLQGIIPASHTVSLPYLRELRLARSSLAILHHLSFPPSADLTIDLCVEGHTGEDPLAVVWARDGLPQILEPRAIKDIGIVFLRSNCVVALSGPHLIFMENVNSNSSLPMSFHSDWLDSVQSLPITTTEVFRLVQPPRCPFIGTLQPQSCARLLLHMPALKHIILDISVVLFFVRALEPVYGQVPCPRLQSLVVIRQEGREIYLRDRLFALSARRRDHGCPLVCSMGSPGPSNWLQDVVRLERIV